MSDPLRLRVRTPEGLLYDDLVSSIRAEDRDGWFGILPGRRDVLATLPPGLLLFADAEGDGFVALSGGLLALRGGECRVMASEARLAVVAHWIRSLPDSGGNRKLRLKLPVSLAGRSRRVDCRGS